MAGLALPRLPAFQSAQGLIEASTAEVATQDLHYDLLSFFSIAQKLGVNLIKVTWQTGLDRLGRGASSTVQQALIDKRLHMAFKRSVLSNDDFSMDTEKQEKEMFRALILEMIALETLRENPHVIELLGVTYETSANTHQVWPVLLMERSEMGTMAQFLTSDEGRQLDGMAKLRLCIQIAHACEATHSLGIIHGDIKLENVLIFPNRQESLADSGNQSSDFGRDAWMAKLIDFGYSCFGVSGSQKVRLARTRPWQAPEHRINEFFTLRDAKKMDVFSFGMLVCRIFLGDALTSIMGLTPGSNGLIDQQILDGIDSLKAGPNFLEQVLLYVRQESALATPIMELLLRLFKQTLHHDAGSRVKDFGDVLAILTDCVAASDGVGESSRPDYEPPKLGSSELQSSTLDEFSHSILEIGDCLADLDDEDYLLHKALLKDLQNRATQRNKCACYNAAARQLWLCYEIGFGTQRNTQKGMQWHTRCSGLNFDPREELHRIDENYTQTDLERLNEALGYSEDLPFDPVALYHAQDRLLQAEVAFTSEAQGRREAFGSAGRSYLSQIMTLTLILEAQGNLKEAVRTARTAATAHEEAYGVTDFQTISAMNYLSSVLYTASEWEELVGLLIRLIKVKAEHPEIGLNNNTTLNSMNTLAAVYGLQGRYDECLGVARGLVEIRKEISGEDHHETITSMEWVVRARLEKGDIGGLVEESRLLVEGTSRLNGPHHESTLHIKEIHAAVLLASAIPEKGLPTNPELLHQSSELVDEVLQIIDPDESEDEFMIDMDDESGDTRPPINVVLLLRCQTTLACLLALQGDFNGAEAQLQYVSDVLSSKKKENNTEWMRLERVRNDVAALAQDPQSQDERDILQWRLAHRWITD